MAEASQAGGHYPGRGSLIAPSSAGAPGGHHRGGQRPHRPAGPSPKKLEAGLRHCSGHRRASGLCEMWWRARKCSLPPCTRCGACPRHRGPGPQGRQQTWPPPSATQLIYSASRNAGPLAARGLAGIKKGTRDRLYRPSGSFFLSHFPTYFTRAYRSHDRPRISNCLHAGQAQVGSAECSHGAARRTLGEGASPSRSVDGGHHVADDIGLVHYSFPPYHREARWLAPVGLQCA